MTGKRGVAVGQQVSDPPLDIKHLCFPMLLRDSGDMVYTIVHAHSTRSVCECGGCGALMFSHAPEGPGEHGAR